MEDFKWRTGLNKAELRTLAEIGALNNFAKHRRDALWKVEKDSPEFDLFSYQPVIDTSPLLLMDSTERLRADYEGMNLTTGPHPMALVRDQLKGVWRACDLNKAQHGSTIRIAGNVICRQRPGTAKGFVFISLEDETGVSNAIVNPDIFEELRLMITHEPFLIIEGQVQNTDNVVLVRTRNIERMPDHSLSASPSHDFH
jgi:error-prone DNA polymerase